MASTCNSPFETTLEGCIFNAGCAFHLACFNIPGTLSMTFFPLKAHAPSHFSHSDVPPASRAEL